MNKCSWALVLALTAALAACSSAGGMAPLAQTQSAATARAVPSSKLTLRIRMPKKKHARRVGSHYISVATKGLTMAFTGPQTFTQVVNLTPADPRCTGTPLVCTIAISIAPGTYTATVDAYDQAPVGGAIPPGANLLSTAASLPVTIKRGSANAIGLTLDGVPAKILVTGPPVATTGTGFLFRALPVTVSDADGYTIVGTYETPITLTDSDPTGATAITVSGSDDPPAGTLLSSSDAAALSYSGKAIVPATITATAGSVTGSAIFDVDLPIYIGDTGSNVVLAQPAGCNSAQCFQQLGGTFNTPFGVAVDASGDVYVANQGLNEVDFMYPNCFGASCVFEVGGGFNTPYSVAVDAAGNVFVADFGNSKIKEIVPPCLSASCVMTLGAGFASPVGVAVDKSDNVYVADTFNNVVKRMPSTCTSAACVTTLPNGTFSLPTGVAIDGNGDVFVLLTFSSSVVEIPAGCTSATCDVTLGGGFDDPYGIAADWFGDVFVADTGDNVAKLIPPGCTSSACVTTLPDTYSGPDGIAILNVR